MRYPGTVASERKPKITQMDTMLQHARMFGFRAPLMPFTRVFLPRSLAIRFHSIHRAENDLREELKDGDSLDAIPVQVVGELRATRYGVLDTGSVVSLRGGAHIFPYEPPIALKRRERKAIEEINEEVFRNDFTQQTRPSNPNHQHEARISAKKAAELCRLFEQPDWNGAALANIIESGWKDVLLRFRRMDRRRREGAVATDLPTGAVSGQERRLARSHDVPTFFLFRQVTEQSVWKNRKFWFPTLIFPDGMRSVVYNDTSVE